MVEFGYTRQLEGLVPNKSRHAGSSPALGTEVNIFSPRTWPADVGVGFIFLGSVGAITVVMLTMVVLFSAKILI